MRSGKPVNSTGIRAWINRGGSSTFARLTRSLDQLARVQPYVIPVFTPNFTQRLSPAKIASSPLVEHYFYPVSTGPINSTTKGKLKKGSK